MPHIVLLGDSIFDNAAYVAGGPDVVAQLSEVLSPAWRATLCAVDGAMVADVARQVTGIPPDATDLVVSAGGNDALGHIDILERRAASVGEVLDLLATIREAFVRQYREMVATLLERELPLTLCTIYEGRLPDAVVQRRAATALIVFNDSIHRTAREFDLAVIELRLICTEPGDYANPIEPSVQGGRKIAAAIAAAVAGEGVSP